MAEWSVMVWNDSADSDRAISLGISINGSEVETIFFVPGIPRGESHSFVFDREFPPGRFQVTLYAGDAVHEMAMDITETPEPTSASAPPPTTTPKPLPTRTPVPSVRTIYAVPSDRSAQEHFADVVNNAVHHVQRWYASQLRGYTFAVEGPIPQICELYAPAAFYEGKDGWGRVISGLQRCDRVKHFSDEHVWVIYVDADFDCSLSVGELGAGGDGVTILHRGDLDGLSEPQTYRLCGRPPRGDYGWIGGLAHELGHAFGLLHPPGCEE